MPSGGSFESIGDGLVLEQVTVVYDWLFIAFFQRAWRVDCDVGSGCGEGLQVLSFFFAGQQALT